MAKKPKTQSYESLVKEYKKLAKRADQRMLRLERAEGQRGYEHITKFAYSKAEAEIERFSGPLKEGQSPRWNRAMPKSKQEISAKIAAMRRFLESETSTKSGVASGYKRRADTLKRKYGIDIAWQDLGKFFESPAYDRLTSTIPASKTAVKALGAIQRNREAIKKAIEEGSTQNLTLDVKGPINKTIISFIESNQKDIVKFLNEFK